jgi:hypothetical protein
MRQIKMAVLAVFLMLGSSCGGSSTEQAEQPGVEPALESARQVSAELGDELRGILLSEIEKGGYQGAVKVCANLAQDISRDFSERTGHSVRRVSLCYRNPDNRPDGYEEGKLRELAQLKADNRLPEETFEVVQENAAAYFRYLRPIVTAPLCVNCHGPQEAIAPDVAAVIAENYPEDKAVGFQAGDLRGAVSVRILLPDSAR